MGLVPQLVVGTGPLVCADLKGTLSRCSARANLTGFFHGKTMELSLCWVMPTRQSDRLSAIYIPFATRVHL